MKVFISWSGVRSQKVAEHIDEWLRCTVQSVQPWVSTQGIGSGEVWFDSISRELSDTSIGIVCLTAENLDSRWILFESGALAKGLDSKRVMTLLIDIKPENVRDPLAQFNHTIPTDRESMYKMIKTINGLSSTPLDSGILLKVFDKYWDDFQDKFSKILKETPEGKKPEKIGSEEMIGEIFNFVKSFDRRIANLENNDSYSANIYENAAKSIRSALNSENENSEILQKLRKGFFTISPSAFPPSVEVKAKGKSDQKSKP